MILHLCHFMTLGLKPFCNIFLVFNNIDILKYTILCFHWYYLTYLLFGHELILFWSARLIKMFVLLNVFQSFKCFFAPLTIFLWLLNHFFDVVSIKNLCQIIDQLSGLKVAINIWLFKLTLFHLAWTTIMIE
jgi:hypothetical protein